MSLLTCCYANAHSHGSFLFLCRSVCVKICIFTFPVNSLVQTELIQSSVEKQWDRLALKGREAEVTQSLESLRESLLSPVALRSTELAHLKPMLASSSGNPFQSPLATLLFPSYLTTAGCIPVKSIPFRKPADIQVQRIYCVKTAFLGASENV